MTTDLTTEILAGRCILRPLRRSDAGLIALHCGDLRVARMTSRIPHPYPPGAAEDYIEGAAGQPIYAIDGSASGLPELCGTIGLHGAADRPMPELGYWVAPPLWRQGIAQAAVDALIAANPLHARQIAATVFQDNEASAKVVTRSGFAYEGADAGFSVARGAAVPRWRYRWKA